MKNWKKASSVFMSSVLLVGLLAGCQSGSKEDQSADGGSGSKKVEITWWNYPSWDPIDGEVGKYEKQLIEAFNKKNPDIKVNLEMLSYEGGPEKVNVAIASKTMPDVIYDYPGRLLNYGKDGLLAPLNDMIDDNFKKDVPDSIWVQTKVGEDVMMYPVNTTPYLMAVNKTLFEKIGALDLLPLDRPDRTWSVAEYEKALEAVKEKAPEVFPSGFFAKNTGGDQGTRSYLSNMAGTRFLNDKMDKVTINSEGGVKALQWVVDGVKNKLVAPGTESLTSNDNLDLFMQGKLASTIIYSTVLKKIYSSKKTVDFEEALVSYPTPDGKSPELEPYLGGISIFNNGDPDKIAAAKKLVDFIANDPDWSKKNLIATGGFSVRNSVTGLYDDPEMKYAELMRKYSIDPPTSADGFVEMRTVWFPELQRALMGNATPKEALDSFAKNADAIFAKSKK